MSVKLHFESHLDYQLEAIDAVCDLFKGQESTSQSVFTVCGGLSQEAQMWDTSYGQMRQGQFGTLGEQEGVGNRLRLVEEELLGNLHQVQERNGLPLSVMLGDLDFTVEMETGTGKTYVYLRTIFELNKRYGFKKFVIVVPSIAIKEGVFKSIELMRDHFRSLYSGVPLHYFLYDSSNLENVRSYATSSKIEIMVCTIQSITDIAIPSYSDTAKKKGKKARRVIHEPNEKTGGLSPITFIRDCRPIVIIDEPQNIGAAGEERGIKNLAPLCTLRYSATHKQYFHPVYCLNAVEASEQKLVKTIEVANASLKMPSASSYMKLLQTGESKGTPYAKMEVMARSKNGDYGFTTLTLRTGDILSLQTGLDMYGSAMIQGIYEDCTEVSTLETPLYVGDSVGSNYQDDLLRAMIKATIMEHLEKEVRLRPLGIKVLSLIFLEHVADYSSDGFHRDGPCARIFEEEYTKLSRLSKYASIYDTHPPETSAVHNGYFSITKRKKGETFDRWEDTGDKTVADREASSRAYELIMRDKERLLSLDEPLKFVFSHSALKEGWDNPNIFQVCVLRDMQRLLTRRQAIGRGLRICVNQQGERVRDSGINRLTVIGKEEFNQFAAALQKEYEQDGLQFGLVTKEKLGAITYCDTTGEIVRLGQVQAESLVAHLTECGLIDSRGKVTDGLREQLKKGTFSLPDAYKQAQGAIEARLASLAKSLQIKNANEPQVVRTRKKVLNNPQFVELWERIRLKTTYRVKFDSKFLVDSVVPILDEELSQVRAPLITLTKTEVLLEAGGVTGAHERQRDMGAVDTSHTPIPDLLTELQERTQLTRRTLAKILKSLEHLEVVRVNAREFLNICQKAITKELSKLLMQGVSYKPVTFGATYWAQELLDTEMQSYATDVIKTAETEKCLTDYVVCDSEVERRFVENADACENVKCYVKLPTWFTIPTPLGTYNPDWALVYEKDGEEHLYLVVETKGVDSLFELPDEKQSQKICCGRKHFNECLANDPLTPRPAAKFFGPVSSLENLQQHITDVNKNGAASSR